MIGNVITITIAASIMIVGLREWQYLISRLRPACGGQSMAKLPLPPTEALSLCTGYF